MHGAVCSYRKASFCYIRGMQQYYEVLISAENQEQADVILSSLLEKKLATGGQFLTSPARFLWKGRIEEMDYITITSFTTSHKKKQLIEDIEAQSKKSQ